jgi:hypothetical protein
VQPFAYAWARLVLNKITLRAGRSKASRTPCAPDPARAPSNTAAGRASPASCCRRGVRTPAAKSLAPTLCGLEAPGAFRRTLHAAHAESWRIESCRAGAHERSERSGVICVHTRLDAGALVELGAAARWSQAFMLQTMRQRFAHICHPAYVARSPPTCAPFCCARRDPVR